jgi:hypothetical protein
VESAPDRPPHHSRHARVQPILTHRFRRTNAAGDRQDDDAELDQDDDAELEQGRPRTTT